MQHTFWHTYRYYVLLASIDLTFLQLEEGQMPQTAQRFAVQYCECASNTLQVTNWSSSPRRQKEDGGLFQGDMSAKQISLTDIRAAE